MDDVVILAAARTAIGKFGGTLAGVPAPELGAVVINALLDRSGLTADQIDEVILGQVLTGGAGQNPARQASLKAGLSEEIPALTINMVCGSGLRAVQLAAQAIKAGEADIIVAGGQENMSAAPHVLPNSRIGHKMGNIELIDTLITDGLWCAFNDYHMGCTAENLAKKYDISREQQDAFAATSQQKVEAAQKAGRFEDEIVPVEIPQRRGDLIIFKTDEFPRHGTTVDGLSGLRPAFEKQGTVTAGNASGINDGAAGVIVCSRRKAEELGIEPMATVRGCGAAGVDPAVMGIGPVLATKRALKRAGWGVDDLERIESNEAFAAQSMSVNQELGWDTNIVNVNGGAIALGHPIGASGARILVTLLYEMLHSDTHKGLATLCIGGGQGVALAVER